MVVDCKVLLEETKGFPLRQIFGPFDDPCLGGQIIHEEEEGRE